MKRRYYHQLNEIWHSLESISSSEQFSEAMVKNLPEPASRYLLHSIRPGTSLFSSVKLQMSGRMRLKPDGKWMSMSANQILAPPRGFVWKARISQGPIRISGADYYSNGDDQLRFWLWSIVPIGNASGPDIVQSAAGRVAIESIWIPTVLLPNQSAEWEALDKKNVKVTISIGDFRETVTLGIGDRGELQRIEMLRWGDKTDDGTFARIPFG